MLSLFLIHTGDDMALKTDAVLGAAALLAGAFGFVAPASAQATRTWVSGVGDDLNPCSRTAPCRTLESALSKTAAGGEINCLDPATFGMFTIDKSVSVICDGVPGGVQIDFDDTDQFAAIIVDIGATDTVVLSGLNIHGNLRAGQSGIQIDTGGALHIRNSTLHSFGGCAIIALDATLVTIDNVTATDNFCGVSLHKASATPLTFVASDLRITNSTRYGMMLGSSASAGAIKGVVSKSVIANTLSGWGTANHGVTIDTAGQVQVAIEDSVFSGHRVGAIDVRGSRVSATVSNSLVAHNATALNAQGGATLVSFGGNVLVGNAANGGFTGTNPKK